MWRCVGTFVHQRYGVTVWPHPCVLLLCVWRLAEWCIWGRRSERPESRPSPARCRRIWRTTLFSRPPARHRGFSQQLWEATALSVSVCVCVWASKCADLVVEEPDGEDVALLRHSVRHCEVTKGVAQQQHVASSLQLPVCSGCVREGSLPLVEGVDESAFKGLQDALRHKMCTQLDQSRGTAASPAQITTQ